MRHWTEQCELVSEGPYLGEDEDGELLAPDPRAPGWWRERLSLWNPTHWPPYLRSRRDKRIVMVCRA